MSGPTGYLALVLHAHLPYVRHPEHPDFLEEHWLFEAIIETYVPLLRTFERLEREGVPFRITLTVTPTLAAMLGDQLLQRRFLERLGQLQELAGKEVAGNPDTTPIGRLARHYRDELAATRAYVEGRWGGNLLTALAAVQERGGVELITCAATHGYLPLMSSDVARRAQVQVGVESYRRSFGRSPRGIWLAECAYDAGVDGLLAEAGLDYFFVDSHGVRHGEPRAALGIHAPVITGAGVAAFPRDVESSKQVWSSEEGYPGDPVYREYYRDLGFDADLSYIRPYLPAGGLRRSLGFKYHRITGRVPLHEKDWYDPATAAARADLHAGNFLFNRKQQARWLRGGLDRPPLMVSPYDAELFGHWWYEGPRFLEAVLRRSVDFPGELELVTASDYLARHGELQRQDPNPCSWGAEGYSMVWLNGGNAWFYRHQHHAERRMERLAARFPDAGGELKAALDQAARELLLAQSSDWAFIVTTGTTVPYAVRRFKEHLHRFGRLADAIEAGRIDPGALAGLRGDAPLFPWLDYRVYAAAPLTR